MTNVFRIARSEHLARLVTTVRVLVAAQYLSPEQVMGKPATSLSHIYSMGIVAYEMLVGHRPFTGSSQVEIAMAEVKQQPPELPEVIGADLRRLVMMALRSEEHTSELQSRGHLVCRLLLEKKNWNGRHLHQL